MSLAKSGEEYMKGRVLLGKPSWYQVSEAFVELNSILQSLIIYSYILGSLSLFDKGSTHYINIMTVLFLWKTWTQTNKISPLL